jgi:hypothetical protein
MIIPKKVIRIYFGEIMEFNVSAYDKLTDQYATQYEGKFGCSWIKRIDVIKEIY